MAESKNQTTDVVGTWHVGFMARPVYRLVGRSVTGRKAIVLTACASDEPSETERAHIENIGRKRLEKMLLEEKQRVDRLKKNGITLRKRTYGASSE